MLKTEIVNKVKPVLRAHNIKRAALLDSINNNTPNNEDEVDLMIEPPTGTTLFDMMDIQDDLERKLKNKVELGTYNSLKEYAKPFIKIINIRL